MSSDGPDRQAAGEPQTIDSLLPESTSVEGLSAQERHDVEDDDLSDSMGALSRLSTHNLKLEELLVRVAAFAVRAIPGHPGR